MGSRNLLSRLRAHLAERREERARRFRNDDGSLSERALHDVYWLLQNCRGLSLDTRMQRYGGLLARRGWTAPAAAARVEEMRAFLAVLLGDAPRPAGCGDEGSTSEGGQ